MEAKAQKKKKKNDISKKSSFRLVVGQRFFIAKTPVRFWQGTKSCYGVMVTRQAHDLEIVGSIPRSSTKYGLVGNIVRVIFLKTGDMPNPVEKIEK